MHHKLIPPSLLALLLAVVVHNITPISAFSTPTTSLLSSGSTRNSIITVENNEISPRRAGTRNIILSYQSDPSLDDDEGRLSSDVDDEGRCNDGGENGRVAIVAAVGLLGAGIAQSVSQLHVAKVCIIDLCIAVICTIFD